MFPSRYRLLIVLLLAVVLTTAPLSAFQPLSGHYGVQKGASWWIWLVGFLQKNGVSLDPDGQEAGVDSIGAKAGVSLDPDGVAFLVPNSQTEEGVSLDPDGNRGH